MVKRAYRYRFYPTEGQAVELSRTLGCVRLVCNRALEVRSTAWRQEQRERVALARAQRTLARKAKGSNNRAKARTRVARVHARIADRRRDLLHKLSTRLVRENQTIVIEDLAVRNMVKNRSLARAISDASWSEFRSMLTYKTDWYGRTVIAVDRWYPSSKTCSRCGHLLDVLPLGVREWACPGCGEVHDRDVTPHEISWPPGGRSLPAETESDRTGASR